MKRLWSKILNKFCPQRMEDKIIDGLLEEIRILYTSINNKINDPNKIQKITKKIHDTDTTLKKHLTKKEYRLTNNKSWFWMWGIWWMNLSNHIYYLIRKKPNLYVSVPFIILFILSLVACYIIISKNKKKRDELFIEAI